MKPSTAAAKLEVYLPATPEEFQQGEISREQLAELQQNPPAWLTELRANGPHPRKVVAARLRISTSGLARAGVSDALTTEQIRALADDPPEWLVRERATHEEVRREERRLEARDTDRRAAAARRPDRA